VSSIGTAAPARPVMTFVCSDQDDLFLVGTRMRTILEEVRHRANYDVDAIDLRTAVHFVVPLAWSVFILRAM
jgi:hypothetical protein